MAADRAGSGSRFSLKRGSAPQGQRFHYVSPNSDLLGWILERASGLRFARLLSELLLPAQPVPRERKQRLPIPAPQGEIEPDPSVLPGAVESLHQWSESIGLFVRLAPEARIVPAIVSGVLSASAQCHLITRLRRRPEGRKRLGTREVHALLRV